MAPRTRANNKPNKGLEQYSKDQGSPANQPTQLIRETNKSRDDDIDDLDLVQLADPSFLTSPVTRPAGFAWSDAGSLEDPPSPKSAEGMAGNIWDLADEDNNFNGQFSSAQSNRSFLPDTMPLSSHALGVSLPRIDLSETASTAQRSSPFQTEDARKALWDLDDAFEDGEGLLGSLDNADGPVDKCHTAKHHSLGPDDGHFSSSELYEATPAKQRVVAAAPVAQIKYTAKKRTLPASPSVSPQMQSISARQAAATQKTEITPVQSADEVDDIATASGKRLQTKDTVASSSAIKPKTGKKSKQRPKSPLKFNEDTQKIKSPNNRTTAKVASKPAQKNARKKTTKAAKSALARKAIAKSPAAKKATRRSARNKDPAVQDKTGDATTSKEMKDHSPVVQQPTPQVQQEPGVQKMSTSEMKATTVPAESPIVLSSDHGSLYQHSPEEPHSQVLQSPTAQRQMASKEVMAGSGEQLNVEISTDQRTHEKCASVRPTRVRPTSVKRSTVTNELAEQRSELPHAIVNSTNETLETPLDHLQTFQRLRSQHSRVISVSDAGSPFARPKRGKTIPARLSGIIPENAGSANTERFITNGHAKYSSPLFKPFRNQKDRRALSESPDTPNRSIRDATLSTSFVLHGDSKQRENSNRKCSDWTRILSLNKDKQKKLPQEAADAAKLNASNKVVQGPSRATNRRQSSTDNESKLTQKMHAVAEDMMHHLKEKEGSVQEISAVYRESVLGCIGMLVRRFDSEEGKLAAGCKRDCDLFMEQLQVVRDAVEDGRSKRRKVLEDVANKYDRRRTASETELLKMRQLHSEMEDSKFVEECNGAEER